MTTDRLCACGCERPIPPRAHGKRVYATDACRQRGHRGREAQRARARKASVEAAVEHRGPLDLAELLHVAQGEIRRRPGSVVLRVAGRLVSLTAAEVAQLAAAPAALAPAASPVASAELLEVVQDLEGEMLACGLRGQFTAVHRATVHRLIAVARDGQADAGPAPQPSKVVAQQLFRQVQDLESWPEIGDGNRLVPPDAIAALKARVDELLRALANPPTA